MLRGCCMTCHVLVTCLFAGNALAAMFTTILGQNPGGLHPNRSTAFSKLWLMHNYHTQSTCTSRSVNW